MFDSLVDLATGSSWTYAVVLAFAAADAIAPIVPSETIVVAGLAPLPWRRFAVFDLAAVSLWALYAGLIGFFGGSAFENEPLVGVGLALGLAFTLGALVEGARRLLDRRRS